MNSLNITSLILARMAIRSGQQLIVLFEELIMKVQLVKHGMEVSDPSY